jgi:hypothetical protein
MRSDPISESTRKREEMEIRLSSYRDCIGDGILSSDKKGWTTTDLDPLALSDSIAIGSLMCSDNLARNIEDISRFFWKSLFEEFFHRDLSDETEPLTIFAFSIW